MTAEASQQLNEGGGGEGLYEGGADFGGRPIPLFDSNFYELYLLHLKIGYMKRISSSY
jgi:hypothetical protein